MSGGGHEGGQGHDSSGMGVIWILVGVLVLGWGVWYFAHTQIVMGYFYIKHLEINLLQFFIGSLTAAKDYVVQTPPSQVSFMDLVTVADHVGGYLRFPIIVILLLLAGILYFRGSASQYSETYTMASLVNKESENWPQSLPVLGLDLVHKDIDEGPWAMALPPIPFAKKYHILTQPKKHKGIGQLNAESKMSVSVKSDRANRLFVMQLGRLWKGVDRLKPHTKALFAAFSARAAKDLDAAQALLNQLSRSSVSGKLDYSGVDHLIEKYGDTPGIKKILGSHAYEMTVMAAMLEFARTDGVLASADFLWLKKADRRLWFVLNTVGRRVAVPEVAGVFSHYLVEKKLRRALRVPVVEPATRALTLAIEQVIYS